MLLKSFFISASRLIGYGRQHADDTAGSQYGSFNHFNEDDFLYVMEKSDWTNSERSRASCA
jgi:hypothetical protein